MIAVGLLAGSASADELPEALQRMIEARTALNGAELEWSYTQFVGGHAGLPKRYVSRYSRGGDHVILELPPEGADPKAEQADPSRRIAQRAGMFAADGRAWLRSPDSIRIYEYKPEKAQNAYEAFLGDVRAVGMGVQYTRVGSIAQGLWSGVASEHRERVEYQQIEERERSIVTGTFEDRSTITWSIRPDKGWNAERVTLRDAEGNIVSESVMDLARAGKTWFPRKAEFYYNGNFVHQVEVHQSSFDAAGLPYAFTLNDMGAEIGMEVSEVPDGPRVVIPSEQRFWDGEQVLFLDEFQERLDRGEIRPGPAVLAHRAKVESEGEPITLADALDGYAPESIAIGKLSLWDAYTRNFIRVNKLDEKQSRDAERVLRDCQEAAHRALDQREDAINEFVACVNRAKDECKKEPDPKKREARFAELWGRQERLFGFLNEIFKTRLEPGLENLLRPEQRVAARERQAKRGHP
jgi:hypothetical protein